MLIVGTRVLVGASGKHPNRSLPNNLHQYLLPPPPIKKKKKEKRVKRKKGSLLLQPNTSRRPAAKPLKSEGRPPGVPLIKTLRQPAARFLADDIPSTITPRTIQLPPSIHRSNRRHHPLEIEHPTHSYRFLWLEPQPKIAIIANPYDPARLAYFYPSREFRLQLRSETRLGQPCQSSSRLNARSVKIPETGT